MKSTQTQDHRIKPYHITIVVLVFIILLIELGLAYLSLEKVRLLSELALILEPKIPSIHFVANEKARIYMVTTLIFIPVKLWGMYIVGAVPDNWGSMIPLPSKKSKITLRMIICFIFLLLSFGYVIYLTFAKGIIESPPYIFRNEQHYSAFKIWYGWSFYRLTIFCFMAAMVFASVKAYFKYFMYLISKDYYRE